MKKLHIPKSKYVTKLNPALCPLACAEITRRYFEGEYRDNGGKLLSTVPPRNSCAFKGLAYVIKANGEIWHIASEARTAVPFENNWKDTDFGFFPERAEKSNGYEGIN